MKLTFGFFLLAACSGQPITPVGMDCAGATTFDVRHITWQVGDPAKVCATPHDGGCTQCVGTSCTLTMHKPGEVGQAVVGHELLHAFGCIHANG